MVVFSGEVALFASEYPLLKGTLLADEVGLGQTEVCNVWVLDWDSYTAITFSRWWVQRATLSTEKYLS